MAGYGVCSLVGLAVLPRLSKQLFPLNIFLGTIALAAAGSVAALERCYKQDKRPTQSSSSSSFLAHAGGGSKATAGYGLLRTNGAASLN